MVLIVLKNGEIYARADGEGNAEEYSFEIFGTMPEYPTEPAGKGKEWELAIEDGNLVWALKDRPLTPEERIEVLEDKVLYPEWVQPTGAHDCYNKGDGVTFNGKHYVSLIDGNVWSPSDYPAGWEEV